MTVDENEFFRQATIQICGSLDIEKAMYSCMQYIAQYIPFLKMEVTLFDPNLGTLSRLASVPVVEKKPVETPILMPREAIELINSEYDQNQRVKIANQPELDPILKTQFELGEQADMSMMVLILVIEEKNLGGVTLISNHRNAFTDYHAHLFSLLREPFAIAVSNTLRFQEILKLKEVADAENRELNQELLRLSGDQIIGGEDGLSGVMEMVHQVAPLDSPVMLLGETGVGKEVIANAIHKTSSRADAPFIKVNCGAIPESLIDSELFGHDKGAFTGAVATKRGRFERAHQGTIFLDEIGELPLQAQVRLLNVIQNQEIERVGGERPISIDVRIISATHRNLEEMVTCGTFREDLWFRLNIFPIMILPLRHRKDDIPELVRHFIQKKSMELKIQPIPPISAESVEQLKLHQWPGNVRELENLVERALILNRGRMQSETLVFDNFATTQQYQVNRNYYQNGKEKNQKVLPLDIAMANYIKNILKTSKGRIHGKGGAADLLGMNPSTLRSRMKKFGIKYNA